MIKINLIQEKEIIGTDCKYCGKPFNLAHDNKNDAIEVDNGTHYLHKHCAWSFGERLLYYAK